MASDIPPVVFDDDNPEWTDEDFAKARPVTDFPALAAALPNASKPRGRPAGSNKDRVTMWIDRDVLDVFRAEGRGWQTRANDALRKAAGLS